MGYLKKFQHDIFVSYARGPMGDTDSTWSPSNLVKNWTDDLVKHLSALLIADLGKKEEDRLDVWFDTRLASNRPLNSELRERVANSATFLCVMSDYYLDSEYCRDELKTFIEANPNALEEGRVFIARMRPTDHLDWPDQLRKDGDSPTGVMFHTKERPGERAQTFSWPKPDFGDPHYREAATRLQNDIDRVLRRLKEVDGDTDDRRSIAEIDISVGRPVLLGYSFHDVDPMREDLRARFRDHNMKVVPATQRDDPVDAAELNRMLETQLANVDALILIAGSGCEKWPRDEPAGHISLQVKAAKVRGVPVYIWIVADDLSSIQQEDYRAYLQDLERTATSGDGLRVRFSDSEEFARYCAGLLNDKTPQRGVEQCIVHYNKPREDSSEYEVFREAVLDAVADGKRAIKRPRDENGQIKTEVLRQDLEKASACVLMCFDGDDDWAIQNAKQISALLSAETTGRMARLCIIGPRVKEQSLLDLRAWKFQTVVGESLDEAELKQVIAQKIEAATAN